MSFHHRCRHRAGYWGVKTHGACVDLPRLQSQAVEGLQAAHLVRGCARFAATFSGSVTRIAKGYSRRTKRESGRPVG